MNKKLISVELSNRNGLYHELDLPASAYEMLDAMERLRMEPTDDPAWEICTYYDKSLWSLGPYLQDECRLTELNVLMDTADGASLLLGLLAATEMLPDALPDDATLDALAASVNTQRLGNHPEALTTAELRDIYVQALTPVKAKEQARLAQLWRAYAG